jgi:multiple sugar transport system substrate-binding protein
MPSTSLKLITALAFTLSTGPASAFAKTEIVVDYAFGGRTKVYQGIADAFMAEHPDVTIKLRVPSNSYEEGQEAIIRQSMVNQLPDVHFSSYNQYPDLVKRGLVVNLSKLNDGQPAFEAQGYIPAAMNLVKVDGNVYGLPFLTGTPILIANGELVRKAGGDCKNLPTDWKGYTDLAARIHALDPQIWGGMITTNDDWQFQSLVYSAGGDILTKDGKDIAFDNESGLKVMQAIDAFVKASGMQQQTYTSAPQSFAAGRVGMFVNAAEYLSLLSGQVGKGFEFCTGVFPAIDPEKSRGTPVGGAAAVILSKDAEKQKIAFDFIRFATGPKGQAILVDGKGYPPVNSAAYEIPSVKAFFEKNPLRAPDVAQVSEGMPWVVFPGDNSVKIVRTIRDNVDRLLQQNVTPEQALKDMTTEVRALMPATK